MLTFGWWKDKDNRDAAKTIVDVLKIVVPVGVVVAGGLAAYFGLTEPEETGADPRPAVPDSIECNSTFTQSGDGTLIQNCGDGEVSVDGQQGQDRIQCNSSFRQDGEGNLIQNCGDGTVIVGLTQEKFFAELERREKRIRSEIAEREHKLRDDLNRASEAEQRALTAEKTLLELELTQVLSDMTDLEASYQTTVEELRVLRLELQKYANIVPQDRLQAAQQAIFEGDRSLADDLLAQLEDAVTDTVKVAADAAYLRGEIAEQEVRWRDAAAHYDRAARLDPYWKTVRKAWEFAWRSGDYGKAFRYGEDLIEIARAGDDKDLLAHALTAHGLVLFATGNYRAAEVSHREAVELSRTALGEDHPYYATYLNNLALAVQAQGRYAEAEDLYRQALEIDRATIGEEHPYYASGLNNLAVVVEAQDRYAEAEKLYRQALEIDRATIGEEHPEYAIGLWGLGSVLGKQAKPAEAREMMDEAMAIFRDTLPADHPDIADLQGHIDALPTVDD